MWRRAEARESDAEQHSRELPRPALDLAAPAHIQTATFALG
jgi:hypothetical protein